MLFDICPPAGRLRLGCRRHCSVVRQAPEPLTSRWHLPRERCRFETGQPDSQGNFLGQAGISQQIVILAAPGLNRQAGSQRRLQLQGCTGKSGRCHGAKRPAVRISWRFTELSLIPAVPHQRDTFSSRPPRRLPADSPFRRGAVPGSCSGRFPEPAAATPATCLRCVAMPAM